MRGNRSVYFLLLVFALAAGGCNMPSTLNLYTVDAISGRPVAGVRVLETDKNWNTSTLGVTDTAGRLDGVRLERNDRLMLTHSGYEPVRLLIDYQDAKPLQPVAPAAGNDEAHKADVPMTDADPFPFAPDHTVTILMHPQ